MWRTRVEPAAVTIRCGRGKKRCDRLAYIFETDETAVVVFYHHSTEVPVAIPPEVIASGLEVPNLKSWDGARGSALQAGLRDEHGTVVCLEREDYWSNIVTVGCRRHVAAIDLSRAKLMGFLREARQLGKPTEVVVS